MTKMSRREIARHVCKDCPANVIEIGEYYLVSPQLWEDKLHLKWDDNLCIGCLGTRLGRKLRGRDLITWPTDPGASVTPNATPGLLLATKLLQSQS